MYYEALVGDRQHLEMYPETYWEPLQFKVVVLQEPTQEMVLHEFTAPVNYQSYILNQLQFLTDFQR